MAGLTFAYNDDDYCYYYWPTYTHCVGGQTSNGRWRLSSSVTRRIYNVTHQGAARGGPVVLRPATATPCFHH